MNMKTTVLKKEVCCSHRSIETEDMACHVGYHSEKYQTQSGGRGSEANVYKSPYYGFSGKEQARQA